MSAGCPREVTWFRDKAAERIWHSSTATDSNLIKSIHPGEVLMEDFIEGFGITQNKVAAITPLQIA
ncbi:hypothetical protein [Raineyella sp. W15-4]|uniref:hypothetical protein n=1 Tax=Raineyella sp. W15-4 TaxID=3081651 RepID=UPI002953FD3D|nr:hypothetical protein [Raineyella sp. W15-4]WOQ16001.1 hypothetical protein R0145_12355 [Raineyella sp. W15-4]